MKTLTEKTIIYAEKQVQKEKDKWECGMKNQYFAYEDEYTNLTTALEDLKALRTRCYELQQENRNLKDQLFGRSH